MYVILSCSLFASRIQVINLAPKNILLLWPHFKNNHSKTFIYKIEKEIIQHYFRGPKKCMTNQKKTKRVSFTLSCLAKLLACPQNQHHIISSPFLFRSLSYKMVARWIVERQKLKNSRHKVWEIVECYFYIFWKKSNFQGCQTYIMKLFTFG